MIQKEVQAAPANGTLWRVKCNTERGKKKGKRKKKNFFSLDKPSFVCVVQEFVVMN